MTVRNTFLHVEEASSPTAVRRVKSATPGGCREVLLPSEKAMVVHNRNWDGKARWHGNIDSLMQFDRQHCESGISEELLTRSPASTMCSEGGCCDPDSHKLQATPSSSADSDWEQDAGQDMAYSSKLADRGRRTGAAAARRQQQQEGSKMADMAYSTNWMQAGQGAIVSSIRGHQPEGSLARDLSHRRVPRVLNLFEEFPNTSPVEVPPTTMMLRNLPNRYTQQELIEEMESLGYAGSFDFFYAPIDFATMGNVGYAFVNFVDCSWAIHCQKVLEGYIFKKHQQKSRMKVATVSVAHLQGLEANLRHFERSLVTGRAKSRRCGPVVLSSIARISQATVKASL